MATISVTRLYRFSAAHLLPLVPEGHKCKNLHGHNYKVEVTVKRGQSGCLLDGMTIDFFDLDAVVLPIIRTVDHKFLNDTIQNPTAECIADWFAQRIEKGLYSAIHVQHVRVWEEDDCSAIWTAE